MTSRRARVHIDGLLPVVVPVGDLDNQVLHPILELLRDLGMRHLYVATSMGDEDKNEDEDEQAPGWTVGGWHRGRCCVVCV